MDREASVTMTTTLTILLGAPLAYLGIMRPLSRWAMRRTADWEPPPCPENCPHCDYDEGPQ